MTAILTCSNNPCFKFIININIIYICLYVSVFMCLYVSAGICILLCVKFKAQLLGVIYLFHLVGQSLPCFYHTVHSRLRGLWTSKSLCYLCLPSQCLSTGIIDTHHFIQLFKVNSGDWIQIVIFRQQMLLSVEATLQTTLSIYFTFPHFFITVIEWTLNLEPIELSSCLYSTQK